MVDTRSVLTALKEYYSPEESDAELITLCQAAAREIDAQVREDADPEDIRLINAAAAIANYRICIRNLTKDDGVTSFKAGDVTVSVSRSVFAERAEKEMETAMSRIEPLLKDEGFFFGQVSV